MSGEVISRPWPTSERRSAHMLGDDVWIGSDTSPSGFKQLERPCSVCGAVMVTVFGKGGARREWRLSADGPQIAPDVSPSCKSVENLA